MFRRIQDPYQHVEELDENFIKLRSFRKNRILLFQVLRQNILTISRKSFHFISDLVK